MLPKHSVFPGFPCLFSLNKACQRPRQGQSLCSDRDNVEAISRLLTIGQRQGQVNKHNRTLPGNGNENGNGTKIIISWQ